MPAAKKYTPQQMELVKEFTVYGIDENDIFFYNDKPEPFFSYEATAMLCQQLTDVKTINFENVPGWDGTTAIRVTLGFEGGKSVSAPGVVNHNEKIENQSMNDHQRIALASARAIRNALKASGINLLKAHNLAQSSGEVTMLSFMSARSLRNKLIAEAHTLGTETGFILPGMEKGSLNKTAWYGLISKRYGKNSSGELTDEQLADFVAFLRSCLQKAA